MSHHRRFFYSLLVALLIGLMAGIYVYQEYLGEDPVPTSDQSGNPFINEQVRAVVTKRTTQPGKTDSTIVLHYLDLKSRTTDSLPVRAFYGQTVQPGDTLTKDKGERLVVVYQKGGGVTTIPLD